MRITRPGRRSRTCGHRRPPSTSGSGTESGRWRPRSRSAARTRRSCGQRSRAAGSGSSSARKRSRSSPRCTSGCCRPGPACSAATTLWRYCFEVDLVQTVEGWKRPVDEPLLTMLLNPRGLGLRVRDGTWLRIVDVERALAGRTYGREGRLILELEDGFCDWNAGRWELEGATEGATCRSSEAEPDLVLGAGELASIYLGAIRPSVLAEAGRLAERTDGSVRRADAMFATELAPWCAHIF